MTATRTRLVGTFAAIATGTALLLAPTAAGAATDPNALHVSYDANGSTTIVRTGSVVKLGPSKLKVDINPDGTFTGTLPLPPSSASFKALGLLPTSATVNFIPVGNVTGTLGGVPLQVKSTARYLLRLTNVTVGGLPGLVGDNCVTLTPVTITTASSSTQNFDIVNGGTLTGTYTIPPFVNCGVNTALIDLLVPGPNNPISLTLSNGQFGS